MSHAKRTEREVLLPASRGSLSTAEIENAVSSVARARKNQELPHFGIGDVVDVHTKVVEGGKERVKVFTGTVIARSGSGSQELFTVRPVVAGEGAEQKFPLHSPGIAKIEVKRPNIARRARLCFLRDRRGKAVRSKQRRRK